MSARDRLEDNGYEDVIFIDDESYDESLIGVSSEGQAVYDFYQMVKEYADHNHCSEEEAQEWIEYNVIRSLPYLGDKAPVIVYALD